MPEPTVEDIAAMRAQGNDFGEYIRMRLASARKPQTPQRLVNDAGFGPLHRPGAWPAGTRSDGHTCHPDCDCSLIPRPGGSS